MLFLKAASGYSVLAGHFLQEIYKNGGTLASVEVKGRGLCNHNVAKISSLVTCKTLSLSSTNVAILVELSISPNILLHQSAIVFSRWYVGGNRFSTIDLDSKGVLCVFINAKCLGHTGASCLWTLHICGKCGFLSILYLLLPPVSLSGLALVPLL